MRVSSRAAERIFSELSYPKCQVAGARTQSKGRMRRSLVLRALPCQPQLGLVQAISSLPNIFMASDSERELLLHFFCRLIFLRSFGHSKTIL